MHSVPRGITHALACGVMFGTTVAVADVGDIQYGGDGSWDEGRVTWAGAAKAYQLGGDLVVVFEDVTDAMKSFTLADETKMSVLCVAGGGGCGAYGCGAGAGGMLEDIGVNLAAGTYTVTVGAGGAAGEPPYGGGSNGGNSVIECGGVKLYEAIGGGAASNGENGFDGGSGGGAQGQFRRAGQGVAGQGYAGAVSNNVKGGGGGAGGPGETGELLGKGGPGRESTITGESVYYAGGGSGRNCRESAIGGGGAGNPDGSGSDGVDGLGGGGGGGQMGYRSGRGGNGVVIVRVVKENIRIAVPSITGTLYYTGNEQTGVASGLGYTLTGATGTAVGSYVARATPESGYAWEDGDTETKEIPWSILPAQNKWVVEPELSKNSYPINGKAILTSGVAAYGTVVVTIAKDAGAAEPFTGEMPYDIGSYVLSYEVPADETYTGLSKQLAFTVTDAVWDRTIRGVQVRGVASVLKQGQDIVLVFTNASEDAEMCFALPKESRASVLCVAGGGGCGTYGCGAGAGGMLEDIGVNLAAGTYTVTVGAGGAAGEPPYGGGSNGGNSVIECGGVKLYEAIGGGAASNGESGFDGGSGGGAQGQFRRAGQGVEGQGFAGAVSNDVKGGGGGAGGPGETGELLGKGGPGRESTITGESVYYAGGGSGRNCRESAIGGGGAGNPDGSGSDGVDGLGGGGGGGQMGYRSGRGGNGVVIVRVTRHNGLAVIVR